MNLPLVTIIIPNYNHAIYLDERIQSCLNQTFQDFEIIILDDKSSDNSKDIIEKYRSNHKVSHIIYNENNSGSTFIQWNKGFELAKGEYIWIAESDDFCDYNLLEELVTNLIRDKINVLAFSQSQFVDSKGKMIPPYLKKQKNISLNGNRFIKKYMLTGNKIYNASSAVFKKKTLENITKSYMKYKAGGDRLFWIEIAKQGNVVMVNKPLNYFRQHECKVSPKRVYDGTVYKEAYQTYTYLKQQGYINYFMEFIVRNHFVCVISKTKFKDEFVKNNLINLWEASTLIPNRIRFLFDKIYHSHQYYSEKFIKIHQIDR